MKFSELVQKLGEAACSLTSNNDCDPEITGWQLLSKQLPVLSATWGGKFAALATTDAVLDFAAALQAQAQEQVLPGLQHPKRDFCLPARSLCSTNPSAQHRKSHRRYSSLDSVR